MVQPPLTSSLIWLARNADVVKNPFTLFAKNTQRIASDQGQKTSLKNANIIKLSTMAKPAIIMALITRKFGGRPVTAS